MSVKILPFNFPIHPILLMDKLALNVTVKTFFVELMFIVEHFPRFYFHVHFFQIRWGMLRSAIHIVEIIRPVPLSSFS